jgi:hypothetical protein
MDRRRTRCPWWYVAGVVAALPAAWDALSPRLTQRVVRPKKGADLGKKTTDFAAGGGEHAKAVQ